MSAPVTLAGRLVKDPELRFSGAGNAIANFTVVTSKRKRDKDTGEWSDADTSFWDCTAFGSLAENVCETLQKGTLTVVVGDAKQEKYKAKDGTERTTWKVIASDAGPSLKFSKARLSEGASPRQQERVPF